MTWGVDILSNNPVLSQVFALLHTGKYSTAAQQLAGQAQSFFDGLDRQAIDKLFASFPPALVKQTPDLQYLQAILSMRLGEQQQASELFIQAKLAYTAAQQPQQVIRCYLALAQITFHREELPKAYTYLNDEIQSFLDGLKVNDAALQADFLQQMADMVFHMGKFQHSLEYAKQALALYTILNNPAGKFYANLRMAAIAVQVGNHAEARDNLQRTYQEMLAHALGPIAEMRWLNVQAHLEWHRRELIGALQTAQNYATLADTEPASNERVYARMLLANLYRDLGQYRTAYSLYMETAKICKQVGHLSYAPQMQAQLAWLYLLEGRLTHVRALVDTNLSHLGTQGSAAQDLIMNFQVILAVLQMMDGEWQKADKSLHEALRFYQKDGNAPACCALHLYLTYTALHQHAPTDILSHLQLGLGWLAKQQLTTYPHWWHPKIMAEVCAHALMGNLYPELVDYILVHHLGKVSIPALKLLEKTEDIELRRRAYRLRQAIAGPEANYLAHLPDTASKRVLQELLVRGELRPDAYNALERELTTASYRHSPNPTIVAVFGLYIAGFARGHIAEKLDCSVENVRNYITIIYQQFDLPAHQHRGREIRRQKLIQVARARGFIH